jgi:hypothetical protein
MLYIIFGVELLQHLKKKLKREAERERPLISQLDLGFTSPILGIILYFFGFVVLTCNSTINFTSNQNYNSP